MTDPVHDPQEVLSTLLETYSGSAVDLLTALIQRWQTWLQSAAFDQPDALIALDDIRIALDAFAGLTSTAVPALTRQAEPLGATLNELLEQGQQSVDAHRQAIAALAVELRPLLAVESELRDLAGQHADLVAQRDELLRLNELAKHSEALQAQVNAVEMRLTGAGQVGQAEQALSDATGILLTLQAEQLAFLRRGLADSLRRADTLETEIRQAAAALNDARERYSQTALNYTSEHREVLSLYLQADRLVADAMKPAAAVSPQDLLNQAQRLVDQAEEVLKLAMEVNERANKLPRLTITGRAF